MQAPSYNLLPNKAEPFSKSPNKQTPSIIPHIYTTPTSPFLDEHKRKGKKKNSPFPFLHATSSSSISSKVRYFTIIISSLVLICYSNMSLSSITLFPLENTTLNRVSILGLVFFMVDILFFPLFLNLVGRIFKHLSRSQSSIKSQLCSCDDLKAQILKESPEFDLSEKIKKDGQICREDVEIVMNELGIFCHPGGEKLQDRLGSNDLLDMFEEKEPSLEEVKGAFDVFDENRDGFIDARELQRVLCNLGFKEGLELDKCRRMIGTYDDNGDGRIDFNEFVKFMENTFC